MSLQVTQASKLVCFYSTTGGGAFVSTLREELRLRT